MNITQEIVDGIAGLIEMVASDAARLQREDKYTAEVGKGMAQSVAAQICQNLEGNTSVLNGG